MRHHSSKMSNIHFLSLRGCVRLLIGRFYPGTNGIQVWFIPKSPSVRLWLPEPIGDLTSFKSVVWIFSLWIDMVVVLLDMINYKGRLISFLKRTTTGILVLRWHIRLWDATFSIYFIMYIEQETYRGISYTRLIEVGLLLFPLSNADVAQQVQCRSLLNFRRLKTSEGSNPSIRAISLARQTVATARIKTLLRSNRTTAVGIDKEKRRLSSD